MNAGFKLRQLTGVLAVACVLIAARTAMGGTTWDGGATDDLWGSGNNWNPNGSPSPGTTVDLTFTGVTRLTPNNNYAAFDDFRSIFFTAGAGSFAISGSSIDFQDGKIENTDDSSQALNIANFSFNIGSQELNPVNANLSLGGGGSIFNNGFFADVYGNNGFTLTIGKNLTGSGGIAINQNSIAEFTLSSAFTGESLVNQGELRLTGVSLTGCPTVRVGETSGTASSRFRIGTVAGGTTATNKVVIRNGSSGTKFVGGMNTSGINTFSGPFFLDDNVTLTNETGGIVTYSGQIADGGGAGTYGIALDGGGTTRFSGSGANSGWTGLTVRNGTTAELSKTAAIDAVPSDLTINAGGTARLLAANQIIDTSDLIVNGTFDLNSNGETYDSLTGSGTVTMGTAQMLFGNNNGGGTFSGIISGSTPGSVVKKGTATITLSGANTWNGTTHAVGGTLSFAVNQGANFSGGINLGETSGTDAATVAVGASGVTITNAITVRSGSSGTKTISGLHASGTGTFSSPITMNNPLTIAANSGGILTMSGPIDNNGNQITVTTTGTGPDINLDGVISDTGKLVKQGSGKIQLNAIHIYTGNTEIDAGEIWVGPSGSINVGSAIYVGNGATTTTLAKLFINNTSGGQNLTATVNINSGDGTSANREIGALNTSGNNTFSGNIVRSTGVDNRAVTLFVPAGGTITFSGVISGDDTLMKRNAGTAVFNNANTYSANTEIDAGALHIDQGGSIAGGTVYVGNGTTTGTAASFLIIDANGGTTVARAITVNDGATGNRTIGASNTSGVNIFSGAISRTGGADKSITLTSAVGGTVEYQGVIDGDDAITVTGGGTTVYSTAAKATTGETVITNSSTLRTAASNLLDDGADLTIVSGSTLDLNGNTDETGWVQGAGNVSLGAGQLRVNHASNRTLSGIISGTGTVVKKGLGTWTLTGANSWSGNIFPVGGTMQFNVNQNAGFAGSIQLGEISGAADATVAIGTGGVTLSNPITVRSGSSGLKYIMANNTSGTATFSGAVTMNNALYLEAVSGGALDISAGGMTMNASDLHVRCFNNVTIGTVGGSGDIYKDQTGGGTLIINGTASHSGNTYINDGNVRIVAGGDITGGFIDLGSAVLQHDTTLELAASGLDIDRSIHVEDAGGSEVKAIYGSAAGTDTLSGSILLINQDLIATNAVGNTLVFSSTVDLDNAGGNDIYTRGAGDFTFSGALDAASGASDLIIDSLGTVTLSGNSGASSFQIEHGRGTLYLTAAAALGTSYIDKIQFTGNSTLRIGQTMTPAGLGILFLGNHTGTIQVDSGFTFTVPNVINDGAFTANLIKSGPGDLTLQAVNTISGTTTINAGVLHMTSGSSIGAVTVNAGGYLKGRGTVGALSVSGTVSPGSSVGTLNAGSTTWAPSGTNIWEINDFAGTYGTDPGWDKLNITGNLSITATSGQPFTIDIHSLVTTNLGDAANFNLFANYTQSIATVSGTISGFASNVFTLVTTDFSNATSGGTWRVQQGATTIDLVYTPPPVPAAPVATAASNIAATSFDANWNSSSGASSYRLDAFKLDEDFADANFTANPVWTADTATYAVLSSNTLPTGVAATDGGFLASADSTSSSAIYTPSTEVSEWRFSLGSPNWLMSNNNYLMVVLMASAPFSGDPSTNNFTGYYLRIGDNGTDPIRLLRKTGVGSAEVGVAANGFNPAVSFSAAGLQDGLNIRVTRDGSGVFSLYYSTGFKYEQEPYTFLGSLTNNTVTTSSYFGMGTHLGGAASDRRVYLDNVDFGAVNYISGFQNKTIATTSDPVTNLAVNTPYVYRVRAVGIAGTSTNSNFITTTTAAQSLTATPATNITVNSFYANWNSQAGALGYELDVFAANDDFSDGDFTASPVWICDTATYSVLSSNTLPTGTARTDGSFLASADSTSSSSIYTSSTETNEWRFSLGSPNWVMSNNNYLMLVLMASAPFSGDPSTNNFTGYMLRIGDNGTDPVRLIRKTGTGVAEVGSAASGFNSAVSFSTAGLQDGLDIRVTRSPAGVFSVWYSTGFKYQQDPGTFLGALTNNTVTSSSYFGMGTHLSGAAADRRVYLDNVTFDSSKPFVSGYQAKSVATTTDQVTGLATISQYFYQARAISAGGASTSANIISVLTAPVAPTAIAATNVQPTSFYANWNSVSGATNYYLDVASDIGFTAILGGYNNANAGNVLTTFVSGLSSGTPYYYRVRAGSDDAASTNSNVITVNTPVVEPSTNPTIVHTTSSTTSNFYVNWAGGDGAGTIVIAREGAAPTTDPSDSTSYVGNNDFGSATSLGNGKIVSSGSSTNFTLTGLNPGTQYFLKLYSFNGSGGLENYKTTAPAAASHWTVCVPPSGVSATDSAFANKIVVTWTDVAGETSYRIFRNTVNTPPVSVYATTGAGVVSYDDTAASHGVTYYYWIRANNSGGLSDYSSSDAGSLFDTTVIMFQ